MRPRDTRAQRDLKSHKADDQAMRAEPHRGLSASLRLDAKGGETQRQRQKDMLPSTGPGSLEGKMD